MPIIGGSIVAVSDNLWKQWVPADVAARVQDAL